MQTLETVNEDPLPATSVTEFDQQTAKITSKHRPSENPSTMNSQSSEHEIKIQLN